MGDQSTQVGGSQDTTRQPLLGNGRDDQEQTNIQVGDQKEDNEAGDRDAGPLPKNWVILYVVPALLIYFGAACLMYIPFKHQFAGTKTNPWVDAAYFSVVTMTSVGYGDIVPTTRVSKVVISFFVFLGFGLVFTLLSSAGLYLLNKQEDLIRKEVEKLTNEDLEEDTGVGDEAKQWHLTSFKIAVAVGAIGGQLFIGTISIMVLEQKTLEDAFYGACSTVTTVGYGDVGFKTMLGRLFGIVWLLVSTLTVAWAIGILVDVYLHSRQRAVAASHLKHHLTKKDIEEVDTDHDGLISFSEYCLLKLMSMGKVSKAEIDGMRVQFDAHDKSRSGHVTYQDVEEES